jgi:hypothetical protein
MFKTFNTLLVVITLLIALSKVSAMEAALAGKGIQHATCPRFRKNSLPAGTRAIPLRNSGFKPNKAVPQGNEEELIHNIDKACKKPEPIRCELWDKKEGRKPCPSELKVNCDSEAPGKEFVKHLEDHGDNKNKTESGNLVIIRLVQGTSLIFNIAWHLTGILLLPVSIPLLCLIEINPTLVMWILKLFS